MGDGIKDLKEDLRREETAGSITIITPAYNRAKLLPRLYESLLHQSVRDFAWLVVDDGSTDDTERLIREYCGQDQDCLCEAAECRQAHGTQPGDSRHTVGADFYSGQ